MLYDGEEVKPAFYDPETGVAKEKELEKLERKEYLELHGKAKAFSNMVRSSGWKIFRDDLEKKISYFTEQLIFTEDEKKIYRLQEAVKIYRQVLALPEYVVYLAASYNQTETEDLDNLE